MKSKKKIVKNEVTLCCEESPQLREFVFAIKGRTFSMMAADSLPIPTTTLIDHNLVRELRLEVKDLKCQKFAYGGSNFRILGRVCQTIQTIKNGAVHGTVHMQAHVVENLSATFSSHSIAGKRMRELLDNKSSLKGRSQPGEERQARQSQLSPAKTSPPSTPSTPSTPPRRSPAPRSPAPRSPLPSPPSKVSPAPPTLSPKPDDQHFYGRIVMKRFRNSVRVLEVYYCTNDERFCTTASAEPPVDIEDYLKFKMGEAVLLQRLEHCRLPRTEDCDGSFIDDCCQVKFKKSYTADEEAQFRSIGVVFPEVPPDLHPGGYYG